MKNKSLEEIINFAHKKLTDKYGYCGVANGDNSALLNSTDENSNDIKIKISIDDDGSD